jgi:hypothetical protein
MLKNDKKMISITCIVTLLFSLIAVLTVPHLTFASSSLATGKIITYSSEQSGYEAALAVDLDANHITSWASSTNEAASWLQVDLGATMPINQIILRWPMYTYAAAYTVFVSEDNVTYKQVVGTSDGNGTTQIHNIASTTARYVKVNMLSKADIIMNYFPLK